MKKLLVLIGLFMACSSNKQEQASTTDAKQKTTVNIEKGQLIYEENCRSCHRIQVRDGFAFSSVWKNLPGEDEISKFRWLSAYLTSSKALRGQGDERAISLGEVYGVNHDHVYSFTDEELALLIAYLRIHS